MNEAEHKPSTHRLSMIHRIIELPLLLQQGEWSQTALRKIYNVNAVTVRRDIRALSDYWPIERFSRGREVFYRLTPDATPILKKLGLKLKRLRKSK